MRILVWDGSFTGKTSTQPLRLTNHSVLPSALQGVVLTAASLPVPYRHLISSEEPHRVEHRQPSTHPSMTHSSNLIITSHCAQLILFIPAYLPPPRPLYEPGTPAAAAGTAVSVGADSRRQLSAQHQPFIELVRRVRECCCTSCSRSRSRSLAVASDSV